MPERKPTRRDFLRGAAARDALADRLTRSEPKSELKASNKSEPPEGCLLRVTRQAMAGQFELFFNAGQYPEATDAALAALDEVDRLEEQLSFFRVTSEVSRINQLAVDAPLPIEPDLFDLLQQCVELYRRTEGAFDVTAGPLSDAWGFSRRRGEIPTEESLAEARARVGSDKLRLDSEQQSVHFTIAGMQINLGAIGKGYALDRCAAILDEHGIGDYMIHGGQSSVLARGSMQPIEETTGDVATDGWTVGVHDPLRPDGRLAEIRLHDRALATSGSEKQFFRYRGRRLSHVLDPRTGWPAEGLISATVVAPRAALADGLSTAMFVLGPEKAIALCEANDELAAFLVAAKGNRVETCSSGFAPDDLTVLV
jgi:thiamine biosynthesis lipoprotein